MVTCYGFKIIGKPAGKLLKSVQHQESRDVFFHALSVTLREHYWLS